MSLGQLTANYADSDEEQFNDSLEEKKSSSRRTSSSTKSPADTGKRKTSDDLEESDTKSSHVAVAPELPKSLDTSSTSFTELSGVIEDDEDDAPPPSSAKASPINSRVEDLRGSEGNTSAKASPGSNTSGSNKATPVKKVNRLVSYANEEDDASEGSNSEDDEVLHSEPMDTGTDDDTSQPPGTHSGDSRSASRPSSPGGGITVTASGLVIIDGIKLPPAPVGKKCSQALQEKVAKAVAAVQRGEQNYNYSIQHKKEFRNPSIYEKLVEHLRLDENGTNYPVALYDPHCWGKESFYEELARIQKEEMEKREKERKERTKVDFIAGTKKVVEEETKKRKSRFDSGRPDMATSIAKPVALMSTLPAPTSAPKTTIDAFGSLNKKLKS